MKKAKIILAAIAFFTVIGGSLAFKTKRFNEFPLWTITGIVTLSTTCTTTVGGPVITYTVTVPNCSTIGLFVDPDSPILVQHPRFTTILLARATAVGGPLTATKLVAYIGCPTFPATFVTLIP